MTVKQVPMINKEHTLCDMACERQRFYRQIEPRDKPDETEPLSRELAKDIITHGGVYNDEVTNDLLDAFITQRMYRENEVRLAFEMLDKVPDNEAEANVIAVAFPRNFLACREYYGRDDFAHECPYIKECFGSAKS